MEVAEMVDLVKEKIGFDVLRSVSPKRAYGMILDSIPRLKVRAKKRAALMVRLRDDHKIKLPLCPNFLILGDILCCKALGTPVPTTCLPPHNKKCILLNKKKRKELLLI